MTACSCSLVPVARAILGPLLVGASVMCLGGCGSGSASAVSVFPIRGSLVASPQTQIAFRGVPVWRLGEVVVIGSRTGRHAGRMLADSDGRGGSFLPNKPFAPGEVVTVSTRPPLFGARTGTFHFTVATPAGPILNTPPPLAPRLPADLLRFRSRPDLAPAAVEITRQSSQAAPRDVFIAPQQGPLQNGPMIIDPNGSLVWFDPIPHGDLASDFRAQRYRGKPVLTWWQGYVGADVGVGEDVITDSSYRQVAVVRAANGLAADLHEFQLTRDGTALITAYYPVYWNASSVQGFNRAVVLNSVVQELDLKTGLVLFQWDSLDHVPLTDSYAPLPKAPGHPFDYFHIDSVQADRDGDLIVSARNAWAAYKIDRHTGRVIWTLGGKHSSFKIDPQASFAFQHDVRVHSSDSTVTVFDDGAGPPAMRAQSRGLTLRLDPEHKTATLSRQDLHSPALLANDEGNVQQLHNGDEFLGWGQQPYFTEYSPDGQPMFDGRFVDANSSYRAYRFTWTATPHSTPAISGSIGPNGTTVYASWNGATAVASWRVLAGNSPNGVRDFTTAPKLGFETTITVPPYPYVAVQALDASGRVLARSATVRAR